MALHAEMKRLEQLLEEYRANVVWILAAIDASNATMSQTLSSAISLGKLSRAAKSESMSWHAQDAISDKLAIDNDPPTADLLYNDINFQLKKADSRSRSISQEVIKLATVQEQLLQRLADGNIPLAGGRGQKDDLYPPRLIETDLRKAARHVQRDSAKRAMRKCQNPIESASPLEPHPMGNMASLGSDQPPEIGQRCPFSGGALPLGETSPHEDFIEPHTHHSLDSTVDTAIADPVEAEMSRGYPSTPPRSAPESLPKCPIRYLDNHSPEEVAKFFENHKHEIPRSHEVCIRRFQSSNEKIKELDAKYGNVTNMIEDLGQKHKPLLTTKEEEIAREEQEKRDRVKNWASSVVGSLGGPSDDHFMSEAQDNRPLDRCPDDVCSRGTRDPGSADSSVLGPRSPSPLPVDVGKGVNHTTKFGLSGHDQVSAPGSGAHPAGIIRESTRAGDIMLSDAPAFIDIDRMQKPGQSHLVFNGPVFIGSSAQDAVAILERLGYARRE